MVICSVFHYLVIAFYVNSKASVFKHNFIFFLSLVKKGLCFHVKKNLAACIDYQIPVVLTCSIMFVMAYLWMV